MDIQVFGTNLFALSGLLTAISSISMAIIMFLLGQSRVQYLWGVFCASVAIWGLGGFLIATTFNETRALALWQFTYVGVIFIPIFFVHFVHEFLELKNRIPIFIFYAIGIGFLLATFSTDLLLPTMRFVFDQFYYNSPPGILHPFFTAFFFLLVIYAHYLLWRGLQMGSKHRKEQIEYFFITAVSWLGGGAAFLPVYQIDFYPITNFAVPLYPIIIGYAIVKEKLFDIRVVAAQLFVSILVILQLAQVVDANTIAEYVWRGALFFGFLVAGYFFIRSVRHEVESRQKIEKLAEDLQKANERLKELDERKSEFVSLASHQLRSPLTAIKGYASMLLEGSFGGLSDTVKNAVDKIFESSNRLVTIIEDFLTISRIEQNRLVYNFAHLDFKELVQKIVEDMGSSAAKKGLTLSFDAGKEEKYLVNVDSGKIAQVLNNLIDNAIKYTPKGSISLKLIREKNMMKLSIADTGVGMSKETREKIFSKFSRANNAHEVNVSGTGLGLFIAKQLAEAHHGRIWAESGGEGKGSTFYIELPAEK